MEMKYATRPTVEYEVEGDVPSPGIAVGWLLVVIMFLGLAAGVFVASNNNESRTNYYSVPSGSISAYGTSGGGTINRLP